MKKILAYTFAAVLLGVVTMLAPSALFVSEMSGAAGTNTRGKTLDPTSTDYLQRMPAETERSYGITPATYSPDFLFIAFMFTLSLITALGVRRHFTRKTTL